MPTYQYVDDKKQVRTVQANSPDEAIRIAPNRESTSGVMLDNAPQAPATTTTTPTTDRTAAVSTRNKNKAKQKTADELYEEARREADNYAAQQRQARIDAINSAFQPRIDRQVQDNKGNMSRVDALNFNKGIIGSGADTTKTGEQKNLNEDALQAIEAEKALEINKAFGYYDELASQRAKDKYEVAIRTSEDNLAADKARIETARKSLESFGKGGVTIDDLKERAPEVYNDLLEDMTDFEIVQALAQSNPAMNAELKYENGAIIQYYTDPKTGKVNVTTTKADLNDNEEFKTVDGIAYGVKTGSDGNLVLRPLTTKKTGGSTSKSTNYTATNIPKDVKADLTADIGKNVTLQQLYDAYPEVSSSYIKSVYDSLKKTSSNKSSTNSNRDITP